MSTWWTPITDRPSAGQTQLRVGRLTKPHGLKGAIKLELYTDDPDRRFVPGAVFQLQVPTSSDWHGKTLELKELRWYNTNAVAFFKDVPDRTVAESLIKAILWVNQDLADSPDEDDAWYDHQLVGLAVERNGERVGTISRVDHLPAQDLLAIATADGEVLVPFVKAIVTKVDVAAGIVTVDPPVGLFEEPPEDDLPEVPSDAGSDASAESGAVDSAAADSAAAESGAAEPADAESADAEFVAAESGAAESAAVDPGAVESAAAESVDVESAAVESADVESASAAGASPTSDDDILAALTKNESDDEPVDESVDEASAPTSARRPTGDTPA